MLSGSTARSSVICEKSAAVDNAPRRDYVPSVKRRHLFVCTNPQASGKPACGAGGGEAVLSAVQTLLIARGAADVLVTPCGCLGRCFDGPNAVVYPEGVWYSGLVAEDAPSLVRHLIEGTPLVEKVAEPPGG
jgi:(2Fe-2S) ferredoxin